LGKRSFDPNTIWIRVELKLIMENSQNKDDKMRLYDDHQNHFHLGYPGILDTVNGYGVYQQGEQDGETNDMLGRGLSDHLERMSTHDPGGIPADDLMRLLHKAVEYFGSGIQGYEDPMQQKQQAPQTASERIIPESLADHWSRLGNYRPVQGSSTMNDSTRTHTETQGFHHHVFPEYQYPTDNGTQGGDNEQDPINETYPMGHNEERNPHEQANPNRFILQKPLNSPSHLPNLPNSSPQYNPYGFALPVPISPTRPSADFATVAEYEQYKRERKTKLGRNDGRRRRIEDPELEREKQRRKYAKKREGEGKGYVPKPEAREGYRSRRDSDG
jgi:hypothetical protein